MRDLTELNSQAVSGGCDNSWRWIIPHPSPQPFPWPPRPFPLPPEPEPKPSSFIKYADYFTVFALDFGIKPCEITIVD